MLDALGLPATIIEAIHEQDAPRVMDRNPRNLPGILYVANLLAGSNWKWLPENTSPEQRDAVERTHQRVAFLLSEVDERVRAMHAVLG